MNQGQAIALFAGLLSLGACTSDKNQPATSHKSSIAETLAGDTTVELLTDNRLETGLTPIFLKLTGADGRVITDAQVSFVPMMAMSSGKQHGCPVIGAPTLGSDDLYHTAAVFQMASSDMGSWSASVNIGGSDASVDTATFAALDVSDSGRAQVFSFTDPTTATDAKFVSSLNFAATPTVGLNPVVFTLHEMKDMMTFVPVDGATIALDPQMPSMGHGSPGSVNPTLSSPGRYEGQLSFSMTGDWETTVTITKDGVPLGSPRFVKIF